MLSTEIIKWSIEEFKPEGFIIIPLNLDKYPYPINQRFAIIWHEHEVSIDTAKQRNEYNMTQYFNEELIYSLLLQRIIEGINRKNPEQLQIAQCGYSMQVLSDGNREVLHNIDLYGVYGNRTPDQAKEQAIEYIYKELKK